AGAVSQADSGGAAFASGQLRAARARGRRGSAESPRVSADVSAKASGAVSAAPGTLRPGGRTARTRAAVFEATLAELALRGYADLSLDGVAARSGVHKTTIYRRWRSRDQL